jgi:hypothetical protein
MQILNLFSQIKVCRSYGFKRRSCPIVYTLEGTLIGDAVQFVDYVKDRYGKAIALTKEASKRRTKQNMKAINEEMRKVSHLNQELIIGSIETRRL